MGVIGLLTDFGLNNNFVGVMKGVIYRINPQAKIVDLCHEIESHNIHDAAFLLRSSYPYFPQGTVFLTVVDPGVGSGRKAVIVETQKYIFVAPDNGVLSFLREKEIKRIIQITNDEYFLKPVSDTFHGRDIFAPVAAHLSRGEKVEKFGTLIKETKKLKFTSPEVKKNRLMGEVMYVDRFGNLITNISQDGFLRFIEGKKFQIVVGKTKITKISSSYEKGKEGLPIAIFDSFRNLEISLYRDDASRYLNLNKGNKIYIEKKTA
ncbi:MAG: SAM-dependent chlorinase/fluorinase [Elusimicrobiota bacterium]|nr:SAM-dependent chlorinase/fluorinase [Elusimicrobiota bacterium]MDH5661686.1 SAM-dependent chlorinase/fluorinase [Elusimicrobiota bacterium]